MKLLLLINKNIYLPVFTSSQFSFPGSIHNCKCQMHTHIVATTTTTTTTLYIAPAAVVTTQQQMLYIYPKTTVEFC